MLIQFASLTIDIRPRYRYTAALCEGYTAPLGAEADFTVAVTEEEIMREQSATEEYPPAYLESLAIYRCICRKALAYRTFLFHGSAIALDGKGYLFTAPSGTGKSTHVTYWRQVWGDQVTVVNDDKPLIRICDDGSVQVCGTPWDGKHRLSTNISVPLSAICVLTRGTENKIVPLSKTEAYPKLLSQTYRPSDAEGVEQTLRLLDATMAGVRLYRMECTMSPDAARIARAGMTQGGE